MSNAKKKKPARRGEQRSRAESRERSRVPASSDRSHEHEPAHEHESGQASHARRRALTNVGGAISTSGDRAASAILARAIDVAPSMEESAEDRAHVHGFHAYPARAHPVTARRLIEDLVPEGGRVLDPFCGSGTTSTVARALGRRSITIEYSEVNAKSAWERITNVGMVPREDAGKPQSTAIFKSRRKRQSVASG